MINDISSAGPVTKGSEMVRSQTAAIFFADLGACGARHLQQCVG